ncbi:MAG TPA: TonB family protein [Polyangia bacterium]|jgi:TonB family protein
MRAGGGTVVAVTLALAGCVLPRAARAQAPATQPQSQPQPAALTKPPRLLRFVEATPPPALARRHAATVVLAIDVDAAGRVEQVAVVTQAGDGFDEAAVAAARRFVFAAGEVNGTPVPVRITYRYRFFMRPAAPAPVSAPSARAPVEGVVLRRGDRTPLPGVEVLVGAGEPATATDRDGRFRLAAVPVGPQMLRLRGLTIVPAEAAIVVKPGVRLEVTLFVDALAPYTSVVRGQRIRPEVVEHSLQMEELARIPGTQGDALKAVQNLPGVARAPLGLGLLLVWGSSPQDTRVYIDGIPVPLLYHFGGLRATINSELVQGITFMPGGYGADYGRGLGGVVEVMTRRPRTDGLHGAVQLDLIDGYFTLEGPLIRDLSFAIGFRRSWIDVFLPYFTSNNFQLTPVYYDYQAKLNWRPSRRDEVELFFFGADDTIKLKSDDPDPNLVGSLDAHNYFHRALLAWRHRFAGGATLAVTPSVGYEVPLQANGGLSNIPLQVDTRSLTFTLRAIVRAPLDRAARLEVGLDIEGARAHLKGTGPSTGLPLEGDVPRPSIFESGYASDDLVLYTIGAAPFVGLVLTTPGQRLTVVPQLRLETLTLTGYRGTPNELDHTFTRLEPRLSARYALTKRLTAKGAVGLYHQPPDQTTLLRAFGNPTLGPLAAWHGVAGFEAHLTSRLVLDVQGFYKGLSDLVVRGERPTDPALENAGLGRVYGGELLLRQELTRRFFGWIAYTLSRSERRDHPDTPWRRFQFDQTHILTAVASCKIGGGWQLGARFRLVTGTPYTLITSSYFDSNTGNFRPLFGPLYGARLDTFQQLDVRVDKTFTFDHFRLGFYLDLMNAYNHANPEGYAYNFDFRQRRPVASLPILPVVGIRGDF